MGLIQLTTISDHYGRPMLQGRPFYFHPVSFFFLLLSSFFFSSPNLSGLKLDVYHTLAHGVALVRIQNAGLKCAARGSLQIQDAKKSPKIAISAPSHNFVGLYLRNQGIYRQSEKNLLSSNIFSTCPHNMVNFGPLTAEIVSGVWGTPTNFNGFCILAALLHVIQQWALAKLCGVEQRAPPVFGRATIRLGIGPHSSQQLESLHRSGLCSLNQFPSTPLR